MKTKQFYHKLLLAKATRTGTKEKGIANIIALLGTVMRMLLLAFVTMAAQKDVPTMQWTFEIDYRVH